MCPFGLKNLGRDLLGAAMRHAADDGRITIQRYDLAGARVRVRKSI